ncbi:MAG TPA: helix-turn-helix domain-containing protein [Flavisolibacter sp.]|jgi:AraC-like DNA-binding protein
MPFYFSRYSGLLLIFFVHGAVYAFLLLRKGYKNDSASDKWLAAFLLLCILYISPWMLGFAGWYDGFECLACRNFLFYMPLQHTLLMGPVIYFYLRTLFQPNLKFRKKDWLHFLPGALYLLWCIIVFVTDRVVLKKYYLMNGIQDPDFDSWYLTAGLVSLLIYLVLCIRYYRRYKQYILQEASFADAIMFKWVRNFLLAFFTYFLLNFIFHLIPLFGVDVDYVDSWWYYLLFALLFYYIAINGYSHSIETRMRFGLELLSYKKQKLLTGPAQMNEELFEDVPFEEVQPATKEITDLEPWKEKVLKAVVTEKAYANPELTLTDLAKTLQTNNSFLSRVINSGFGQNFNDFINYYRVEEVKQKLTSAVAEQVTIMSIAYDAGFNSKATFNRAFKKFTGKNPKDFLGKGDDRPGA